MDLGPEQETVRRKEVPSPFPGEARADLEEALQGFYRRGQGRERRPVSEPSKPAYFAPGLPAQ